MNEIVASYDSAGDDFHRARRKARMQMLISRLQGKPATLLSYEEVRQKLGLRKQLERGLVDIPLDSIIGSVGRYTDFTRTFLPRIDEDRGRWARVKVQTFSMEGLPAIEVYQIGDAYFVRDGNHRVSVARDIGANHIQAYVTEIISPVPLSPDDRPDDLILKAEYAKFLEWSKLHEVLPEVDLLLTAPGKYDDLQEHIHVHRYYMGIDNNRSVKLEEAVEHWYNAVYQPMVQVIRQLGVLRDFPQRTEADLYLWLSEYRAAIEKDLGWKIETTDVAEDLAETFSSRTKRSITRFFSRLRDKLAPASLWSSSRAGAWRERLLQRARIEKPEINDDPPLLNNILISLDGKESGNQALSQAIEIAKHEQAKLFGLHIVPSDAHKDDKNAIEVENTFNNGVKQAGINGEFAYATGTIARAIAERARWVDLVVAPLNFPPDNSPIARLRSGFRNLLLHAPCPVLAVPRPVFPIKSALLAYDGSPTSNEALYITAYLATHWDAFDVHVLTIHANKRQGEALQEHPREYMKSMGIKAHFYIEKGSNTGELVVINALEHDCDLIIMGSYGRGAILEMVVGSTVNSVLRTSRRPVLICR